MANIIEYEENDAWPDGKDSLQHKNEPHNCTFCAFAHTGTY